MLATGGTLIRAAARRRVPLESSAFIFTANKKDTRGSNDKMCFQFGGRSGLKNVFSFRGCPSGFAGCAAENDVIGRKSVVRVPPTHACARKTRYDI